MSALFKNSLFFALLTLGLFQPALAEDTTMTELEEILEAAGATMGSETCA